MLSGGSERYVLFSQHDEYNQLSHVMLKARLRHAKSGRTFMRSRTVDDLSACILEPAFSSSYSGSFKKLNLHYTSGPMISTQINVVI